MPRRCGQLATTSSRQWIRDRAAAAPVRYPGPAEPCAEAGPVRPALARHRLHSVSSRRPSFDPSNALTSLPTAETVLMTDDDASRNAPAGAARRHRHVEACGSSDGLIARDRAGKPVVAPGALDLRRRLSCPGPDRTAHRQSGTPYRAAPQGRLAACAAIVAHDAELASTGITTVFDALRVGSIHGRHNSNYGEYARALADEILGAQRRGRAEDQPFPASARRGLLADADRGTGRNSGQTTGSASSA